MAFPDDIRPSSPDQKNVRELPLFPLDLVLFPGMKMSLHIFEERYKEMIGRCLEESSPFGIVLVRPDQQTRSQRKIKTFRIGCTARILQVERLGDGEMNLEIEGVERFHLIEHHEVESYRTGIVEVLTDKDLHGSERDVAEELCAEVQGLLKEFLTRQLALMGQRIVEFDLPDDPSTLSLITGCILPIENNDKQSLLEMSSAPQRLEQERDILRRAITRLRRAASAGRGNEDDSSETLADSDNETVRAFEQIHAERYRDCVCPN